MMSSSANYRPFLSSFRHIPPSGGFSQVSELTVNTKKWRPNGENVYLVQLGPKSFGDGRQDICKDKASNLRPAAGKKLKPKRLSKTPLTYVNLYSFERSRYFFVGREQISTITSRAKLTLCKDCNQDTPFIVYLLKGRRVTFRVMKLGRYVTVNVFRIARGLTV